MPNSAEHDSEFVPGAAEERRGQSSSVPEGPTAGCRALMCLVQGGRAIGRRTAFGLRSPLPAHAGRRGLKRRTVSFLCRPPARAGKRLSKAETEKRSTGRDLEPLDCLRGWGLAARTPPPGPLGTRACGEACTAPGSTHARPRWSQRMERSGSAAAELPLLNGVIQGSFEAFLPESATPSEFSTESAALY